MQPTIQTKLDLQRDGYAILSGVLRNTECKRIGGEIDAAMQNRLGDVIAAEKGRVVGARNLLSRWSGWRELVEKPAVQRLVCSVLGDRAGVVRVLFFDKPPGEGWSLALHQDRTIAVRDHCDPLNPFAKPTRKAGVPHVEATKELLQRMLTLRFHLDAMHDDNGPLIVVPGSHDSDSRDPSRQEQPVQTIHCGEGDVFVMRPLLSHGSRASNPEATDHRRVLHLELAADKALPGRFEWHQFEPLGRVFD